MHGSELAGAADKEGAAGKETAAEAEERRLFLAWLLEREGIDFAYVGLNNVAGVWQLNNNTAKVPSLFHLPPLLS